MLTLVVDYLALLYVTWIFFLAVMSVKAAKDVGNLPKVTLVLAYPMYITALLLDFTLNMASTFVFLERPHDLLLTHRCDRHLIESDGWRWSLARAICRYLLDPFQVGGHCVQTNE